jgi:hypothetical protein
MASSRLFLLTRNSSTTNHTARSWSFCQCGHSVAALLRVLTVALWLQLLYSCIPSITALLRSRAYFYGSSSDLSIKCQGLYVCEVKQG